ncbi:MAG: phosphate ABC transporter permease subunit PstC [Micrococcus sp.]|nr:phosphate ABC transporter permease subunit PstC [Micrococcus sp.]
MAKSSAAGRAGDKIFSTLAIAAAISIFLVLGFVAIFLTTSAMPALTSPQDELSAASSTGFWGYVAPLLGGTLIASFLAILIATPIAVGVALYISHYAPRKIAQTFGYIIDLLAAIPSVVYGAWGMFFLAPAVVPLYRWLNEYLGFLPIFGTPSNLGRTVMTASVVLAIMILPIVTSLCREIFLQTPKLHEEAALALGATKWEMVKMSVFPFARGGIVSSVMLGLGRALGETMAVTMVLSTGPWTWSLISSGNATIPSEIALNFPESYGIRQSELIAAGLVLFIITLAVNMLARWIVNRHKEFSGAN